LCVTSDDDDPFSELARRTGAIPALRGAADAFAEAAEGLRAIDREPLGKAPDDYRRLAAKLGTLAPEEERRGVRPTHLFKVDLVKPAPELRLGQEVTKEILRGVEIMSRVCQPPRGDRFDAFKKAFVARYERRSVP